MKNLLIWNTVIWGGFLLGSIPFCYFIPKWIKGIDIVSNSKDHNPGASNVFSLCGISIGIICLFLDIAKGIMTPYYIIHNHMEKNLLFSLVMIAPVLGHAVGMFLSFRGGKSIATTFGVMIALLPVSKIGILLAVIYIVLAGIIRIKPNRKCSIITFSIFGAISPVILTYYNHYSFALGCMGISIIVLYKHLKSHDVKIQNLENQSKENQDEESELVKAGKLL